MLKSFRVQTTVLFGVLSLVVVGALSYQLGTMLTRQIAHERTEALRSMAEGVALLLGEGLHERLREVDLLAQASAGHGRHDAASWAEEIARLRSGRPHYAWIGVTDVRGTVVSASDGLLVGRDVSQRPWFAGAVAGTHYLGDVHPAKLLAEKLPAPADGEPLRFIDFAAPLRAADGTVTGVLGVHADWRWVRDVVAQLVSDDARNAGVSVYVLDRSGHAIHHPLGPAAAAAMAPVDVARMAGAVQLGGGPRELAVGAALPLHPNLPDLGWMVVVQQPEAVALAAVSQAQRAVRLYGCVAALTAMALAWWLAGWFSRPLGQISAAAERIGGGDRSVGIHITRRTSELSQLSVALSRMTQALVAREQSLQQANQQLEGAVAARTAELVRVNSELARANHDLDSLAHQDGLTGLHNRRSADALLAKELAHHRRHRRSLAVLLGDIDHFKRINDSHGHAVGDQVLQAVAACIRETLRESDVAARFGGEEFLVILPETDAAGLALVGEKVRAAVAALELPGVGGCRISLGGAVADQGRGVPPDLLRRADDALYAAKHAGRDRLVLAEPVNASAVADSAPAPLDAV